MPDLELTILMPCLNEAETLATCIGKARGFLDRSGVHGEVVIADNGSTDGSQAIARAAGARVVDVPVRGYGAALAAGIEAARGRYVIMGDADDSYDFEHLDAFVEKLRGGADLVMGNRFKGGIAAGAMPWHHRYIGNPVLSFLGRLFFGARIGDFHCGLRGFRRDAIAGLNLRTTGMEFASEMVVKATLTGLRVAEVPTTLAPDGRSRPPHLRSFRDGWRHLRFLLLFSPRWLFLYPGLTLLAVGLFLGALLVRGPVPLGPAIRIGIHTFLVAAMCIIVGAQSLSFAVIGRRFASRAGFIPKSTTFDSVLEALTLERVLAVAAALVALAFGILIWGLVEWARRGFGDLTSEATVRAMIIAMTCLVVGVQTVMSAFLASFIDIPLAEQRLPVAGPAAPPPGGPGAPSRQTGA
ncbi:MAG: glycosyltransferase family 2 protein [Devosia sp.]|nr:glycosyltransferase family 2 protein [Devosia sp.]